MTTRDVFRWHMSPADLMLAAILARGGAVMVALDGMAGAIERWLDRMAVQSVEMS